MAAYAAAQEEAKKGQASTAASAAKPGKSRPLAAQTFKRSRPVDVQTFIDDEAMEVRGSARNAALESDEELADPVAGSPDRLEEEPQRVAAVPVEVRFFFWSAYLQRQCRLLPDQLLGLLILKTHY